MHPPYLSGHPPQRQAWDEPRNQWELLGGRPSRVTCQGLPRPQAHTETAAESRRGCPGRSRRSGPPCLRRGGASGEGVRGSASLAPPWARSPPAPVREPYSLGGPARPAPGYRLALLSSGAAGRRPCLSHRVIFGSPSRLVLPRPGELTGSKKAPWQSREAKPWHIQFTEVSLTCQERSGFGQGVGSWEGDRPGKPGRGSRCVSEEAGAGGTAPPAGAPESQDGFGEGGAWPQQPLC